MSKSKQTVEKAPPEAENLLVGEPERDAGGRLTHKGMRQVIARGGSVVHNGRHFNSPANLPDVIKLEGTTQEALDGMEEDVEREEEELERKKRRIAKQRKRLEGAEDVEDADEEANDYAKMNKADLVDLAKKAGIENADDMKKDELVEALQDQES